MCIINLNQNNKVLSAQVESSAITVSYKVLKVILLLYFNFPNALIYFTKYYIQARSEVCAGRGVQRPSPFRASC